MSTDERAARRAAAELLARVGGMHAEEVLLHRAMREAAYRRALRACESAEQTQRVEDAVRVLRDPA